MKINVRWDDDSRQIIHWWMAAGFTWDEFSQAVDESVVMMNTVAHRVDLLAVSETAILPTADAVGPFRRSVTQKLANANGGYLVIVGGGQIVAVLMKFLKTTIPRESLTFLDIKFQSTEVLARRFLTEHHV